MPLLNTRDAGFEPAFAKLLDRGATEDPKIAATVAAILADVRTRGDAAVLDYTQHFDRHPAPSMAALEIKRERLELAQASVSNDRRSALIVAAARIREYHEKQKIESWNYRDADGTLLGQQVTALDRVGLYVPGGRAAYPSSVLMNAIPAKVAGVGELIMTVPAPAGELNDMVLAAAAIAGVDRVFTIGGAQAVGALAYGTATIPQVDKIVGPGNAYVAQAKRQVFGQVAIDMIAGPSEVVVVADSSTDPAWVAMDLFSQAEHDEDAQAILITWDAVYAARVMQAIAQLLPAMARVEIISKALERRSALITVGDTDEAVALINRIAPEHLELAIENALDLGPRIRHAGAIFFGRYTPEAIGDYCAGPNHVLPTSGTARFSSPLGVYDFQKRTSIIMCPPEAASRLSKIAATLAHSEGLTAHARSAEYRIKDND
ncbi:MAG: histidinol dehydrogenase [Gammaproteobacteria bacterium]|nr:histidinol dehydrogenase [Gammaproteobacteria bacterium]